MVGVIGASAVVVFLLNVRGVAAALGAQRADLPERILEDEAILHPLPEPKPANPWEASEPQQPR